MSSWNHHTMFDRYLYDYLVKNNMHQTAEIFKEEANVSLDPAIPHAIDVPDGFLHEWWLTFYEMYSAQQPMDHVLCEGLNIMGVEQNMGIRQHNYSSQPQYAMNQQAISRVLTDADSWFNAGVNAVVSRRSDLTRAERVPQVISPSSNQHGLLESKSVQYLPGYPANLPGQGLGCSVPAATRREKDIASEVEDELILPPPGFENYAFNSLWMKEKHQKELRDKSLLAQRSGGKSINTTDTIYGNFSGSCNMDTISDASFKSDDENVNSSCPHAIRNKDNADSSSIILPESATTADDLKVHQVVESEEEGVVESKKEG